jgi:hypothetical protein
VCSISIALDAPQRRVEPLLRAAKLGLIHMSSQERTAADYYNASLEVSFIDKCSETDSKVLP